MESILSVSYRIHMQWISSNVNIQGNEIADALAKAGADDASVPSAPLTYLELFSRVKSKNKTIWLIPSVYHCLNKWRKEQADIVSSYINQCAASPK
ncbi:hypothetical protein AVEN_30913-1 [Araneus ventricosus]|uniref:Uncharacterized protein n=1 Tax=Araneus ventricosus TaxID=182803 RepID=A0A4Y2QYM4_ARAVE|nr:hypothetical protein AVEN_30913-1 [Araneus ventricosus]